MIHWLLESTSTHPGLAQGICPDGLLNDAELRHWHSLRTPKRRREWLLGRWTAKRLLQAVIARQCGLQLPYERLTILNAPSGAPIVSAACLERVTLSFSHCGERAFGAAWVQDLMHPDAPCALGADLERVEPRIATFADDYFSSPERNLVSRSDPAARDLVITALWSAKEAALKAAHLGLTVDARAVTCWIDPVEEPPRAWTPFQVTWDSRRLQRHARVPVQGWWRSDGDCVMTLAASPAPDALPEPLPVEVAGVLA